MTTPAQFMLQYTGRGDWRCIRAFGAWCEYRTGRNPVAMWGDVTGYPKADDASATIADIREGMTVAGFRREARPATGDIVAANLSGTLVLGVKDGDMLVWAAPGGGIGTTDRFSPLMAWRVG